MNPRAKLILTIAVALVFAGAIIILDPSDEGRNWIVAAWFVASFGLNFAPVNTPK